jgi:hypothetical protein
MWPFKKKIELKIGQVWAIKSDDPFRQSDFVEEIVDIKNKYIQTQSRNRYPNSFLGDISMFTKSYSEQHFRDLFGELVSDCE